ncbi:MAG TPA: DUF4162 domain-containing protein, partial [Solirubrobacteraceae bacterium]
DQLKAEVGQPTVEVSPVDPSECDALADLLSRFGQLVRNGRGRVTVPLPGGETQLAALVRTLDEANVHVATLELHRPSLDDVFLAKTGRKLEGAATDGAEEQEAPEKSGGRRRGR